MLDTQIYLNSGMDKGIMNLMVQNSENKFQDMIYVILCENYKGKWWFYRGPTYVIPRENYTDNPVNPLPLHKLLEIARKNSLNWYYVEKENGTCLKELFNSGYENYKKCKDEEYLINDKYFEAEIDIGMNPDPENRTKWYLNEFLKSKHKE